MNKYKILALSSIIIITMFTIVHCKNDNSLISDFKEHEHPLCAADNVQLSFSEINFKDPDSVLNGSLSLSNDEDCKTYFHSKAWRVLDQMKKDGDPYWKDIDILKERSKKTFFLSSFGYTSLEAGSVRFVIMNDENEKKEGVLFALLFIKERDGWRMAISHEGYGEDIKMFYEDASFWKNKNKMNEVSIKEELRKIREQLKEPPMN